jgi:acyl-CoA reductase-like NAD-dependent aldehyde dehydrogenase
VAVQRIDVLHARSLDDSAEASIAVSRHAQRRWGAMPVARRLAVLRRARHAVAAGAAELAALIERRAVAESLTSEVLPLLEAGVFLERNAARILSPGRYPSYRAPIWLRGVEVDIDREPFGVVLIVAPSNYPLMLPGIQTLQALAAGNSVIVKPGAGGKPGI